MLVFILKMKSIFKIGTRLAAVMAAAVLAGGCGRDPGALVPAPPDGGDAQRLVIEPDDHGGDRARRQPALLGQIPGRDRPGVRVEKRIAVTSISFTP